MRYRVITNDTELARGSRFIVWPVDKVEPGQLTMIEAGRKVIVGRWWPNIGGFDFVQQPLRLIAVTGQARIIGAVIPCEDPPEQTKGLTKAEIERALKAKRRNG